MNVFRQLNQALLRGSILAVSVLSVLVITGCQTKKPAEIVYINRQPQLGLAESRAKEAARLEVQKWDAGATIRDTRVQRHRLGWTVSVLLTNGVDEQGKPLFDEMPVRNVEIDLDGNVTGYHVSQ
ncbi:MAG: hypothetical protein ACKVHO_17570 [Verrucomicrobiia bacterium]|jgi:hypothetical protein